MHVTFCCNYLLFHPFCVPFCVKNNLMSHNKLLDVMYPRHWWERNVFQVKKIMRISESHKFIYFTLENLGSKNQIKCCGNRMIRFSVFFQ